MRLGEVRRDGLGWGRSHGGNKKSSGCSAIGKISVASAVDELLIKERAVFPEPNGGTQDP